MRWSTLQTRSRPSGSSAWYRRREPRTVGRVSRYGVLALLASAAVVLSTGSAASQATPSKREGMIAFIRLVDGPVYGGRLFVVRPDGGELRQLTPQGTTVQSYAWSPDGTLIAYIDQRLSLWLVRRDGTGRRMLLPSSRLSSFGLSWSPDGKSIAIVSPGPNANPARAACSDAGALRRPGRRQQAGAGLGATPRNRLRHRLVAQWRRDRLRRRRRSSRGHLEQTEAARGSSSPPASARRSGRLTGRSLPPRP